MDDLDLEVFKNPPSEYRGIPFFSVNDKLEVSKLQEFATKIKEAGFGGVFFHAREGLITPFLSDEWFEAFEKLAEAFRNFGLELWMYDEDRWPSGFASGLIASKSPKFRAKALILVIDNKGYHGEEVLAVFKCELDEVGLPRNCFRVEKPEASSNYIYLTFIRYTASTGDPWFQGFSYVDLLNPEVVDEFIKVSYEPYATKFKSYFGSVVKGVFTDEPNIHDSRPRFPHWWKRILIPPRGMNYPVYARPWTDGFEEYFEKVNGYSIVEKLPELFFDIGSYVKTRYDYWRTVTMLFVESFTKKLYEWCEKHGLKLTGHFLAEDNLLDQLTVGSVMPHYEYMQVPGIDHLGYQIWGSLLTAKQVSSVANQLGKTRVLCETYGELGYFASFEDRKWIGDFLYALGVNMLNHHLLPYSLRGRRKADYGLFFHPSQPWWKYNKVLEDYYARLSYALSKGKRIAEVLVYHPIGSVWSTFSPVNDSSAKKINEKYFDVLKTLVKIHVDFELGDEIIMEKYGRVENGYLVIGRSRYKLVVLPPVVNISSKVLNILANFSRSGGVVIVVEQLPSYVDGVKSDLPGELLRNAVVVKGVEELSQKLTEYSRDLTVVVETPEPTEDVIYHARLVGENVLVFVVNVSRSKTHYVRIGVKGKFRAELWDPFTGNVEQTSAVVHDGRTLIETVLEPVRSKLYVFKPGEPSTLGKSEDNYEVFKQVDLKGEWKVEFSEKNNLVLDYAKVWLPEKHMWTPLMPLSRIKEEFMITRMGSPLRLKFEFTVEYLPGDLELVVEYTRSIKRILVNEFEIDLEKPTGMWLDWNFKSYRIPGEVIRHGINEVVVEVVPSLEPELEPLYIRGTFRVILKDGKYPVILEPSYAVYVDRELDLSKAGYPFYAGEATLTREVDIEEDFERATISISNLNAALAVVEVNGCTVAQTIYRNSELDITKYLKKGKNTIKLVLVGTLRNVLGPLHREHPRSVYPELFYVVDSSWRDEYIIAPFGFESIKLTLYRRATSTT